ncbi:MAG TPA: hypothetical protein VIY53_11225 [Acidobacteriaceae bacterium]
MSVLRNAGFEVVGCTSFEALLALLDNAASVGAVVMADASGCDLSEVRERSTVPLVLFQSALTNVPARGFDLVVAPQTHPQIWLRDLGDTIERSQAMPSAAPVPDEIAQGELRPDGQVAQGTGAEASRVADWHSVAVSIARKQTPPARPGSPESTACSAKPARQV